MAFPLLLQSLTLSPPFIHGARSHSRPVPPRGLWSVLRVVLPPRWECYIPRVRHIFSCPTSILFFLSEPFAGSAVHSWCTVTLTPSAPSGVVECAPDSPPTPLGVLHLLFCTHGHSFSDAYYLHEFLTSPPHHHSSLHASLGSEGGATAVRGPSFGSYKAGVPVTRRRLSSHRHFPRDCLWKRPSSVSRCEVSPFKWKHSAEWAPCRQGPGGISLPLMN